MKYLLVFALAFVVYLLWRKANGAKTGPSKSGASPHGGAAGHGALPGVFRTPPRGRRRAGAFGAVLQR